MASPVSANAVPSRRYGSQRPVARSGSPNGPWLVTAIAAAAPVSMISGICCASRPLPIAQCPFSAARSTPPHTARATTAAGTRRLRACSQARRAPEDKRQDGTAGAGGLTRPAAITGVAPG